MKKTFCDMCEKETKDSLAIKVPVYKGPSSGQIGGLYEKTFDVCDFCRLRIIVIIEEGEFK